jgi:hypothetical protein
MRRNHLDATVLLGHHGPMDPGGIEGVGDALTGGIVARQLEPAAGEARDGEHQGACLNCGAPLAGPYCGQCGQRGHVHRSLAAFWHDLAHGVLHFEGKIWRTLPLLAWRPGQLTRRYIEGERARFVSPIALFLFSVFLMFAVFNAVGGPIFNADRPAAASIAPGAQARLTLLQSERAKAAAAGRSTSALDLAIASAREQVATAAARKTAQEQMGAVDIGGADDLGWFGEAYRKAKQNPALLIYKLQANAYKFSWALIPISVPFLWALFLHRRRYRRYRAYDHVVFVTYSLSFMTLLIVFLSLLYAAFGPSALVGLAITFIPPIHIYRQLRGAYALKWFSALWRTAVLVVFAGIALSVFLILLLALGVMH